jgi:hypothetical protein
VSAGSAGAVVVGAVDGITVVLGAAVMAVVPQQAVAGAIITLPQGLAQGLTQGEIGTRIMTVRGTLHVIVCGTHFATQCGS